MDLNQQNIEKWYCINKPTDVFFYMQGVCFLRCPQNNLRCAHVIAKFHKNKNMFFIKRCKTASDIISLMRCFPQDPFIEEEIM